jgi:hypothetical protein
VPSTNPSSAPTQKIAGASAAIVSDLITPLSSLTANVGGYGHNLNFEFGNLKHWDTATLSGGEIVVKCDDDGKIEGDCFAQIIASTQEEEDDDETCMSATLSRRLTLVGIAGVAEYFEIEFWYRFKDIDPADTMEIIIIEQGVEASKPPLFQETITFSSPGTAEDTVDTGWLKRVASLGYHVANDQKVVVSMKFSVANGKHGTGGCISSRISQGLLDGINIITYASAPSHVPSSAPSDNL